MSVKTHQELVLDEIVRQWPERVEARAQLIQRPLGHDDVSDQTTQTLYMQRNPNPQAVLQAIAANPAMTDAEVEFLIYPQRKDVLDAIKKERGWKGLLAFQNKMAGSTE